MDERRAMVDNETLKRLGWIFAETSIPYRKFNIWENKEEVLKYYNYAPHISFAREDLKIFDYNDRWAVGVNMAEAEKHKIELTQIISDFDRSDLFRSGILSLEIGEIVGKGDYTIRLVALGAVLGLWDVISPRDYLIPCLQGLKGRLADIFERKGMIIVHNYLRAGGVKVELSHIGGCDYGSCYIHSECSYSDVQSKRAIHIIINSCDDANKLQAMFANSSFNPSISLDGNNVLNGDISACDDHEKNLEMLFRLIDNNDGWVTKAIIEQSISFQAEEYWDEEHQFPKSKFKQCLAGGKIVYMSKAEGAID